MSGIVVPIDCKHCLLQQMTSSVPWRPLETENICFCLKIVIFTTFRGIENGKPKYFW